MLRVVCSPAALKYPVGPVQPKGASGYAPRAAPETAGEPDYAALARGEPGFRTGGQVGGDMPLHGVSSGSSATAGLPPSATGATSGSSSASKFSFCLNACLGNQQIWIT